MNAEAFFRRQATITGDAAFRAVHPADPFTAKPSFARGAELYRQAIRFWLAAHAAPGASSDVDQSQPGAAPSEHQLPELSALLATTAHSALRQWALTEAHLQRCIQHLGFDGYAAYAALDEESQQNVCSDLGAFHRSAMVALSPTETIAEVKRFKRELRWFVLAFVVVTLCVGVAQARRHQKLSTDLTTDAAWSISSRYGEGCRSPEQECPGGENYFFHTNMEKNPWLMFDFRESKSFSSIEVINRMDCCTERANPLIVSVSDDKKVWRVVAESRREFATFEASFPAVSARYVKLEIPHSRAMLHLSRVRIFP
jgi:hypothetical protein